jgi:hypothetical protein
VEIKNKKSFNILIKSLVEEIVEEEDLDEITTTAGVDGYNTPFAFTGKKGKKKKKQVATNSTGYKPVNETLDKQDLEVIRKLIKDVIGDVYRDIWLKRNAWK